MKVGLSLKKVLVILLSLAIPYKAAFSLADVPTFRLSFGESFVNITAGSTNGSGYFNSTNSPTPVGSALTLNPMFLWDIPSIRSRIGVTLLMDLGSQYGFMTAVGVGVSGVFYPMGLSSGREARDDGVEFVKTRMSPYFHFAVIPTKISFSLPLSSSTTTPTSSSGAINQPYFAAEVIETDLGVGLDYPFSENIVAFVELEYRFAAYTAQETTTGAISYSGPALMLGIMTNFY